MLAQNVDISNSIFLDQYSHKALMLDTFYRRKDCC